MKNGIYFLNINKFILYVYVEHLICLFFQPSTQSGPSFFQNADTVDQAAVEATAVTLVMMKGEEVGKIKSKKYLKI